MKHSFYSQLDAYIELSDEEFEALWKCCEHHYDHTVMSSTKQGGFLYGHKNSREFSNVEYNEIRMSSREINLMCKSLEMAAPMRLSAGIDLHFRLSKIFFELQHKAKEINDKLSVEPLVCKSEE